MADSTINNLPVAAPLTGAEVVPIVQAGATVKVPVSTLSAGALLPLTTAVGTTLVGGTWFGNVIANVSALASSAGASLIGFIQNGTGAVARSLQDSLREFKSPSPDDFISGTVTDSQGFQLAANYCATSGKSLFLPRIYQITSNVTLPASVSVFGRSRVNCGLNFVGTATLSISGSTGTQNSGALTLSRLLFSHSTSGVGLAFSEFVDVLLDDCEFYHVSLTGTAFSYLTFNNCVGFGMSFSFYNATNALNQALKFMGGRFSDVKVTSTETTDVLVNGVHILGGNGQISLSAGNQPAGLFVVVAINDVVVDSTNDSCVILNNCSPRISNSFFSGGRTNLAPGLYLHACSEGSITNIMSRFCGSHGMQIDQCYGITLSGDFTDNNQNGVQITNCDRISFVGGRIGNTATWYGGSYSQQYGIVDPQRTCTNTLISGVNFVGNAIAPLYINNAFTKYGVNIGIVTNAYGTASVTLSNGEAQIPHGLGDIPIWASALAIVGGDNDTQVIGLSSTTISIRIHTSTTNANATGTYSVLWKAQL